MGVYKLQNYAIQAKDGEIGSVHDALLDDEFWILRYLVVDTSRWLPGRKVLLTPAVLGRPDWRLHQLAVDLTRDEVRHSPGLDSHKTISRQQEIELHNHYGWPFYWGLAATPSAAMDPFMPAPMPEPPLPLPAKEPGDQHLQSVRELQGYHIEASDGELGHVDDFIVDDQSWEIRYMVVATSHWLPHRKVLISPHWLVGNISWAQHKVKVNLTREAIRNSPPFDSLAIPSRVYESELHDHYSQPGYWTQPRRKWEA
jgi:hypothetical protein